MSWIYALLTSVMSSKVHQPLFGCKTFKHKKCGISCKDEHWFRLDNYVHCYEKTWTLVVLDQPSTLVDWWMRGQRLCSVTRHVCACGISPRQPQRLGMTSVVRSGRSSTSRRRRHASSTSYPKRSNLQFQLLL